MTLGEAFAIFLSQGRDPRIAVLFFNFAASVAMTTV
jgi:hypothetical protein